MNLLFQWSIFVIMVMNNWWTIHGDKYQFRSDNKNHPVIKKLAAKAKWEYSLFYDVEDVEYTIIEANHYEAVVWGIRRSLEWEIIIEFVDSKNTKDKRIFTICGNEYGRIKKIYRGQPKHNSNTLCSERTDLKPVKWS
ncbi:uncharacterized protein LOC141855106 [Brevipalpus obovatus]|uniref:uncharacterized protein LOC141855106 n=1 Tax=Brevipalpus obovatus TaxID=246614 RepID=UPI003D9F460C